MGRVADLATAAKRVQEHLNRRLARLRSPFVRGRRRVTVGYSMVFFNPLVMPERLVSRLVEEAWESVRIQRMQYDFQNRCMVQELLLGSQIRTVFQPVVDLRSSEPLGWEALSRGPSGTDNQAPLNMFEAAERADLVFELDRHCRQTALGSARNLPSDAKLFLNMFPASMWDPDLQGTGLIETLGRLGLGPDRIVLEISEKYAIENYTLFVDAMKTFTDMGFEVAVDDVGAGHSGLEKIAHLNPRYLKLDMGLVQDIDTSFMRRETARIVKAFAEKAEAAVIAEGIEREGELEVVKEMGIEFGQGYLLGRPSDTLPGPHPGPRGRYRDEVARAPQSERPERPPLPRTRRAASRRSAEACSRSRDPWAGSSAARAAPRAGTPWPRRPPPRRGRSGSPRRSPGPS